MRVSKHPILGDYGADKKSVTITVNGQPMEALEGEPRAAALMANGIRAFRKTPILHHPRGIFCAIGRCTDCALPVDGIPNVRTCVTRVREGMKIETQDGLGEWGGIK